MRFEQLKLVHFIFDRLFGFRIQRQLFESLLEFFDFGGFPFLLEPKLLFDGLQLFLEEKLSLLTGDFFLDLLVDFARGAWKFPLPSSSSTRTRSMRVRTSKVSSTSCNSAPLAVVRLAEKSASLPGSSKVDRLRNILIASDCSGLSFTKIPEGRDHGHGVGLELFGDRQFRGQLIFHGRDQSEVGFRYLLNR